MERNRDSSQEDVELQIRQLEEQFPDYRASLGQYGEIVLTHVSDLFNRNLGNLATKNIVK